MPNTLKLTPTEDGHIKVRVVSQSERDQSAVVSYEDLQFMIRQTQVGDEAELPLEPDEATGNDGSPPVDDTSGEAGGIQSEGDPDTVPPDEVDLSVPVEGEPQIDQEPSAPADDNEAEPESRRRADRAPGTRHVMVLASTILWVIVVLVAILVIAVLFGRGRW